MISDEIVSSKYNGRSHIRQSSEVVNLRRTQRVVWNTEGQAISGFEVNTSNKPSLRSKPSYTMGARGQSSNEAGGSMGR